MKKILPRSLRFLCVCFFSLSLQAQWVQVSGSYGGPAKCVVARGTDLIAATANGIFRSSNGGLRWSSVSSDLTGHVLSLASDATNLFAGTTTGTYRSSNDAVHWTKISTTYASSIALKKNVAGDVIMFAARGISSVDCSTDTGATWKQVFQGGTVFIPPHSYVSIAIGSVTTIDSSVLIGTSRGVYRSTNDGSSWSEPRTAPAPDYPITCLAVQNSYMFASEGVHFFRSADSGATWVTIPNVLPRNAYNTSTIFSFAVSDSTLYAGTAAGVFCSIDHGTTWLPRNEELNASSGFPLAVNGHNVFFGAGGGYHLARSSNDGANWTVLDDSVYYHYYRLAARGPYLVAGTDGPFASAGQSPELCSSDNGASWNRIEGGPAVYQSLALNDSYIFVGMVYGTLGVMRCPIDSSTWTVVNSGLTTYSPSVTALAVAGQNIYAATSLSGLFYSSDEGVHWSPINSGLDLTSSAINVLAINGSTIFAGTTDKIEPAYLAQGMFRSTDHGGSWISVNNGLTDLRISSLVVRDSMVLVGTDSSGVFLSTDNGSSWVPCNNGLPNPYVSALALNDDYVYAGLLGGVWRAPFSELVTSVPGAQTDVPLRYSLSQNYPNPFNPNTSIRYSLPSLSRVHLIIYNVLGQVIADLVNAEQPGGWNEVVWNANVSSGLYFYRIEAVSVSNPGKRFVNVKKMILLK